MAARAALDRVGLLVADSFVKNCVMTTDPALSQQRVGRVLELVFSRFSVPTLDEALFPEQYKSTAEE